MPTNIGPEGSKFNLRIPEINENADIQTAFRIYHYGDSGASADSLPPQSMAGYLDSLNKGKISSAPQIIPSNANLNNYTQSGFYAQDSDAKAQTGSNYPEIPSGSRTFYAGLLRVFNDGKHVYQEYQVSSLPTSPVYWRSFFNDTWFSWRTYAPEVHIHDDRYFTRQEVETAFLPTIKFKTVRNASIVSNNYTINKNDEDCILLMNNGSLPHNVIIPQDPSDSTQNIIPGTTIRIVQSNTGQTTIVPQNINVNIRFPIGNKLRTIHSVAYLVKLSTNTWVVYGDLETSKTKNQLRNDIGIYVQQSEPTGNIQNGDLWFW